jgi:hypothetical protein
MNMTIITDTNLLLIINTDLFQNFFEESDHLKNQDRYGRTIWIVIQKIV